VVARRDPEEAVEAENQGGWRGLETILGAENDVFDLNIIIVEKWILAWRIKCLKS